MGAMKSNCALDSLAETGQVKSVSTPAVLAAIQQQPAQQHSTPALPRLAFTMDETAKMLGISYISVHRLLKRGLLKSSKALRHKLIPAAEIQRFLNA